MSETPTEVPEVSETPWPNQFPVVEGLVDSDEVSQDPDLFADDDSDYEMDESNNDPEED